MATLRKPILGWSSRPDDSGKAWFEPFDILATNDVWDFLVGRIDEAGANNAQLSTRAGFHGRFEIPKDYIDAASLIIVWTATVTSGNAVWDFEYRAVGGNDSESLDQAGTQESLTVTDAAPGAALRRLETSIDLTDGNFAVDDDVTFFIANDGTDGADTLAGARLLINLLFQYENS